MDDRLISRLGLEVPREHIAHAYLFEGDSASTYAAMRAFAKYALCDLGGASVSKWESGSLVDYVEADEPRLPIRLIRELCSEMYREPLESEFKVIAIPDADKMQREAQNALLKSLEEPPSYIIWLLSVDRASKLVPTILSRCRIQRIPRAEKEEMVPIEGLVPLIEAAFAGDVGRIFSAREFYDSVKDDSAGVYDQISAYLRAALRIRLTGRPGKDAPKAFIASAGNTASLVAVEDVLRAIEKTAQIRQLSEVNVNKRLALETLFLSFHQ